jgi:hypothetical protein
MTTIKKECSPDLPVSPAKQRAEGVEHVAWSDVRCGFFL